MRWTMRERWVLVKSLAARYQKSGKKEKSQLLEEFIEMTGEFNFRGAEPGEDSLLSIPEQRCGAGPPPGEGAIAPDVGIQDVLQCATCHYRHRASAEDSQTPVRNSDHLAVESRRDLASCHGSIGRIAAAHS